MRSVRWSTPPPWRLAAYLEGELRPSDAAAVESYLAESSEGRRQLEQMRSIRAALSTSGRASDKLDLLPSIKARMAEHTAVRARATESGPERSWRRPAALLWATGVLAAAVCLAVAFMPRERQALEFAAKSASQAPASARWAGVQAYRVRAGVSQRLGETLAPGDGLLFSYTNLGRAPLANLMIFAVDARAEIHWFHPAYEREGTDPSSITIEQGGAEVPLAELIQDEFPAGPLTIHAWFTNEPLQVLEVENWLKRDPHASVVARVPGSVEQVLTTRVEPRSEP